MIQFFLNLLKNPKVLFLHAFFTKWYIMMMVPAIVAAYFVISGLEEAGVIRKLEEMVRYHLMQAVYTARECTPKIVNLKEFISCLPE